MFAGPQQTLFPNERSTYPEACMKSRLVLIAFLLATPQLAVADDICAKNPAPTQQSLYPWLDARCYVKLYDAKIGWTRDKEVRDTGPYIGAQAIGTPGDLDYGVHPAVRIYYSPEVMKWLTDGRKGVVPDGSVIVKEMYYPPNAAYYNSLSLAEQATKVTSWTVMVKKADASSDGWFWSYHAVPTPKNTAAIAALLLDLKMRSATTYVSTTTSNPTITLGRRIVASDIGRNLKSSALK